MNYKEYIVFKQQQQSNNITLRIEKVNGRKWNWLFRFTNEVTFYKWSKFYKWSNKMISVYYL